MTTEWLQTKTNNTQVIAVTPAPRWQINIGRTGGQASRPTATQTLLRCGTVLVSFVLTWAIPELGVNFESVAAAVALHSLERVLLVQLLLYCRCFCCSRCCSCYSYWYYLYKSRPPTGISATTLLLLPLVLLCLLLLLVSAATDSAANIAGVTGAIVINLAAQVVVLLLDSCYCRCCYFCRPQCCCHMCYSSFSGTTACVTGAHVEAGAVFHFPFVADGAVLFTCK